MKNCDEWDDYVKTGQMVTFALSDRAARASFSHLRLLGYECADLQTFVNTDTEWFSAPDREARWREIGLIARDAGIAISQTHGPWRFPPRDADEADRAERFEKMSLALEGTAAVGAPVMVVHNIMPFGCEDNPEPARFMDLNRDFFSRLLAKARSCGVTIALENMPFPGLILSSPAQILSFAREFHSPYMKVCLDTGHAAVLGWGAGDSVRLIGKDDLSCLHVHDNDGKRDLHWLPYQGVIDWADFSRALIEIGYEGSVSLETDVFPRLPADVKGDWERALALTARSLTQNP